MCKVELDITIRAKCDVLHHVKSYQENRAVMCEPAFCMAGYAQPADVVKNKRKGAIVKSRNEWRRQNHLTFNLLTVH